MTANLEKKKKRGPIPKGTRDYTWHHKGQRKYPIFTPESRICELCKIDYIALKRQQIYCSLKCRSTVISKRHLEKNNNLEGHLKRLLKGSNGRWAGRDSLSFEFIKSLYDNQQGRCALTGMPMTWGRFKGHVQTHISLDRISSYAGYAPENVQLVCHIVNIMKNNLGQLEFIELCHKITTYQQKPIQENTNE